MKDITICVIQTNLFWENRNKNLALFDDYIKSLDSIPDIILLPEMFNNGFSFNINKCAETVNGETVLWMKKKASEIGSVIIGSLLIRENGNNYNRLFWIEPNGNTHTYNKRHLFRMAGEHNLFSSGNEKLIVSYKGWKFCPMICYDLRFPIWSKNKFIDETFDYDCLIYIANWPESRRDPWMSLLTARAIENQAYVVGLNCIGEDGREINHSGDSRIICPKGKIIKSLEKNEIQIEIITLSKQYLNDFRSSFQVGLDWDVFDIKMK